MKIILATAIVKKCLNVWNTQELAQNCKSHISIYLSIYSIYLYYTYKHIYIYIYMYKHIYDIYIYIKYLTYITYTYTHTGIFVDADIYVL